MRRFLLLTVAMAVVLSGFYSRPTLSQQAWRQCSDGLPLASEFPEAERTCKNTFQLAPFLGTPDVVPTKTGRCVLSVTVCGGRTKCYISEERPLKDGFCKDFQERYNWMAGRTICCDPKCEKPTPWFAGSGSSKCRDVQGPEILTSNIGTSVPIYLGFCTGTKSVDTPVFQHIVPANYPGGVNAYKAELEELVKKRVGSKVCCDKWREAVRTGVPCNPLLDMDCDGKPNNNDFYTPRPGAIFPDINNLFATGDGAQVDQMPTGLNPDDLDFLPPAEKCDCKWELLKGTLICSPDGKRPHEYRASWYCPSTGNTTPTRKEAPVKAKCDPKAGTMKSFFRIPDSNTDGFSYTFWESLRQDRPILRRRCGTNRGGNVNGWWWATS